ncbi:hypothetical protein [Vallitalea okinawensis]|uniref:hypothetical protein n=1 Tax=Vallitalea okinawensis TaxID=2078660 RepID=UPI000CFE2377|nr:hypothetical protein [Vallitalea okinawensis]
MLKYEKDMEKEKFNDMDTRSKIQHIGEYYKWHIIGTIIGGLILFSLLNLYIFNPPATPSAQIVVAGAYVDQEATTAYELELREALPQMVTEEEEIMVLPMFFGSGPSDPSFMAATQKLMAMTAANEIDILIGDEENMKRYAERGYFADLDELMGQSFVETYSDQLVEVDVIIDEEYDENGMPYATEVENQASLIMVNDSENLRSLLPASQEVYIGILVNSKRMDNTLEIFDYIIQ